MRPAPLSETGSTALFGMFDGLTSAIGVIAAGLATGAHERVLVATAAGLAVAAAVSMGGGEFLADNDSGAGLAVVMAGATLAGSVLPAVPYLLLGPGPATGLSVVLCVAAAAGIAELRQRVAGCGRLRAWVQTGAILVAASGLAVVAGLAFGAGG